MYLRNQIAYYMQKKDLNTHVIESCWIGIDGCRKETALKQCMKEMLVP
jgi:hypothetical protein